MAFRSVGDRMLDDQDAAGVLETAEIEFTEDAMRQHSSRAMKLLQMFTEHV